MATEGFATVRIQLGAETTSTFLGDATIEVSGISLAKTATSDETEAITASGLSNVNGVEGQTDGKMHYWANSATVNEATHYLTDDTYVIDYSNATGEWWGFQIFWMLDASQLEEYGLTEGDYYQLTFKLTSSVAGTIQVVNDSVDITANENEITVIGSVNSTSGNNCTFHIWMGIESGSLISEARVVITDINFEEYVMPSTHDNSYVVDFSSVQLATQKDELYDSTAYNYLTRWSNLTEWGGPYNVSVTDESLDASGYTAKFTTTASSYWYDFQLFYQGPETDGLATGVQYYVEMKINVDKDVYVTINDVPTQLYAGDNDVTVISGHKKGDTGTTWDYQSYAKTDLEFQAGVDGSGIAATELTLTISYLAFYWDD